MPAIAQGFTFFAGDARTKARRLTQIRELQKFELDFDSNFGTVSSFMLYKKQKKSAGILLYRKSNAGLQVFLVHPGGPYWENKDDGAWSIPKGEFHEDEEPLDAARREFHEETGSEVSGPFIELTPLTQPSGKVVHAWAVEGDIDPTSIKSNLFSMQWPPKSGKWIQCPEVDKGAWFTIDQARKKLLPGQRGFLDELLRKLT